MKYGEIAKWWGSGGRRKNPHEGLDLAAFIGAGHQEQSLRSGLLVPPVYPGRVLKIFADFQGRTIVMEHDIQAAHPLRLLTFMAHIHPASGVRPGVAIPAAAQLGEIAPGNNICPPHLHISTAWVNPALPTADLSWENFQAQDGFHPCDPLQFIAL